jgi:hypothetical protein
LPPEIISIVCLHLPNRDIKNLRLTNRGVCSTARLRLDRVFLSPNPCNIDVLKAVADHPVFSKAIAEIIWDDARLVSGPQGGDSDDEDNVWDDGSEPEEDLPEGCPAWFARACRDNNEEIKFRVGDDIPRPSQVSRMRQVEEQMPPNLAWEYYEQLLLQQEEILQSEADVKALRYGLERFPSLKRITITPAVHGLLYEPAYETPMIRSFPYGFNYPIPRTWPLGEYGGPVGGDPVELPPWNETDQSPYRGFNCVLRELATTEHHVSEFVIDVCTLGTGINYRIFDNPSCVQYRKLTQLLRRPGFRRLDLHLNADGDYWRNWTADRGFSRNWTCLRNGHLHRALSEAKDLRHFTFGAFHDDMQFDQCVDKGSPESRVIFTPIRTFLPLDRWERLQHFGLSNLFVRQDDLLSVVNELPSTLTSLELSFLTFLDGGSYHGFFEDLRQSSSWGTRSPRPKIITNHRKDETYRYFHVEDQAYKFSYNKGENPFSLPPSWRWTPLQLDWGILRDPFDPEHDRPYTHDANLMRLGIIKWQDSMIATYEWLQRRKQEGKA